MPRRGRSTSVAQKNLVVRPGAAESLPAAHFLLCHLCPGLPFPSLERGGTGLLAKVDMFMASFA